ncbi:Gfo/Idh/MocA family oxidoreductase, partial [Patescibacteria group bacterium]|nr:Gfo/Idh/MocA family oxidoreductase [Patescibacteria group bacterium]
NAIADGSIKINKIISNEFSIDDAPQAYQELKSPDRPYSLLLSYNTETEKDESDKRVSITSRKTPKDGLVRVGLIGAGGFATAMHLPNLQKLSKMYSIHAIANRNGLKAKQASTEFNASYATSDYHDLLKDNDIDLVIITTRHDSHAQLSVDALNAGKAVLVEKPMALNEKEMRSVADAVKRSGVPYMVGFNRRFSPFAKRIKDAVKDRVNPLMIYYRMNAGYLSPEHWTQGSEGGGRIIGEACHIIDLFNFWTESPIIDISVTSINSKTKNVLGDDNVVCTVKYEDGSVCSLIYTGQGNKNLAKEHLELFYDGNSIIMDDYTSLEFYGTSSKKITLKISDKGHLQELIELYETLVGKDKKLPISLDDLLAATEATFKITHALKK